jgi:hypothetical protein
MAMNRSPAVERFSALAVKRNLSLGMLQSAQAADFALVLAAAASAFVAGRGYTEREVNGILIEWLAGSGSMLAIDHVALRRWLVDTGVLGRDGFGHAYALGTQSPEIAQLAQELAGIDLATVARDARAHEEAKRAERKRNWEQKQRGTGD